MVGDSSRRITNKTMSVQEGFTMNWEELYKLLSRNPIQRDISHRVRGIEHEAGKITSAQWLASAHPSKANIYYTEMRKELGDLIAMTKMLCLRMGWSYEEVEKEGMLGLMNFIIHRMEG